MEKKKQRVSNFGTAAYIAENYGYNVSDEKLTEVAKAMKLRPKILIENYKEVVSLRKIVESIKAIE